MSWRLGKTAVAIIGFSLALVSSSSAQIRTTATLQPDYADWVKDSGIRVTVRVRVNLRADGSVETARLNGCRVEKSAGPGSDEKVLDELFPSAISAARGWRFEDLSNPLPASVDITFDFHNGIVSSTFSGH